MRYFVPLLLFFFLTLPAFAQKVEQGQSDVQTAEYFEKLGNLFQSCAEKTLPAVVNISVKQNRAVSPSRASRSPRVIIEESGSGFVAVIDQKQVILTNRHVIGDAEKGAIEIITHDRRILTPLKVSSNSDFDIAVIEVAEKLPASIVFGDSNNVHIGEIVLAAGNPFGLNQSLSMGIISAVGRRQVPGASGTTPRIGFFQTDAAVNPGSSGGILLNIRGEVIGILTAIATQGGGNEGIAFAMPISAVLPIAEQLVKTGTVIKPFIGFGFDGTFSSEERQRLGIDRQIGAKIQSIAPNTPAEQAGLQAGDVILSFDNIEVEDDLHVTHLVAQSEVNKPVMLRINRDGQVQNIAVAPSAQLSR